MPISLTDYYGIKEKIEKSDRELLKFFRVGKYYTTSDIQKYLNVNNAATLGRLKKLKHDGFVELKIIKRIYNWCKVKDMEDEQILKGWLFGG